MHMSNFSTEAALPQVDFTAVRPYSCESRLPIKGRQCHITRSLQFISVEVQ